MGKRLGVATLRRRSFFSSGIPTASAELCRQLLFSMQLTVIFFVVASLASSASAQNATTSPPSMVLQSGLPSLRLVRTLAAPNEVSTLGMLQSGNFGLTWSPDGERLAAYVHNGLGIITWSPDGKYQHEFPRYSSFGLDACCLNFLSGHRLIIASPAAETNSPEDWDKMNGMAFAVLDAETGKVLRNVAGPNPSGRSNENTATDIATSPDERFVAVIYREFTDRRVGIYSTGDWQRVAALDLRNGNRSIQVDPQGVVFSPDGRTLAVLHNSRVKLFEVGSWTLSRSIEVFPDTVPRGNALVFGALAFSPDGTMIAAASNGGGSWWTYPNGKIAAEGYGVLRPYFPAEPLRVFRVADGALVASLGLFPGGIARTQLVWSPKGNYLGFLDGVGDIRFWDPFRPGASAPVTRMGLHSRTLRFSKDGSQLVANFEGGVKVFDVVTHP
ncbi:WD40 repeat domain-containing protein [Bradyrhizobium murdochi]|uniref:WD40 repeat domain-containing protein n=1 Tax=Bradyrhizobium murdochi TaxID=1038859 RepID=UPI0018DC994B|nr:PD40 domain-containing protein [Bradyrhizobium murdochi]